MSVARRDAYLGYMYLRRKLQTKLHYVVRETVSNFESLEGVRESRRKDGDVTNLISNYIRCVYAVYYRSRISVGSALKTKISKK